MSARTSLPATIASAASLSDAVDLLGYDLVAVQTPAAWTAAGITFETSADGVTYTPVTDSGGTEVTLTVAASKWVAVPDTVIRSFGRFVKVRSGTSAVPVAQGAARTVRVIGACS